MPEPTLPGNIPPAPRGSQPYEIVTQSGHVVKVSLPVEPSACRFCDVPEREHMQRWKSGVGWHVWAEPTQEQRKERMLARAADRTVAPDTAMDEFEAANDLSRRWE